MGLFDSIINTVSNVASSALDVAMDVAKVAFPQVAIAASVGNMLAQGLGQAVSTAANSLTQIAGMPKFIADEVGGLVGKAIGHLIKPSDPQCDHAVHGEIGNDLRDFFDNFSDSVIKNVLSEMEGKTKGGKAGGGSWYEALAKALGQALDAQADKIADLSKKIDGLSAQGQQIDAKADPKGAQKLQDDKASTMTELQAASQKMSFMMSASDNVLKTLGEALGQMARK